MCVKMTKDDISKHVWSLLCGVAVTALITFICVVAQRNVGAARARREIPPLLVRDVDPSPHIFTTRSLPSDDRMMCSVGNGHIATDVFSKNVYMNGLYNGANGESHRARIPSWFNLRLNATMIPDFRSRISYSLDTKLGIFQVHVDRDWSTVEQRIYAHRYYTRALVNQIIITAKNRGGLWRDYSARFVELSFIPGPDSEDIKFDPPTLTKIENRIVWYSCGRTKTVEDRKYQEETSQVCAYWTHSPTHLVVPRRGRLIHTFVMTVDFNKEVALKEITDVLQEKQDDLFEKHKDEWEKINHVGNIEIGGNLGLAKNINAILYYFLSSLPSKSTNQNSNKYYGLSPGGLSRGGLLKDYEGHNFWDTEIWMFPIILLFHPDLAENLLTYRISMAAAASDLAAATGNRGIRYPWESAFTGVEVTQPCCPEVAEFEHHITGCIAFAARQYIAATGDQGWLKNGGCSMIMQIAEFWASRTKFNESTGFYDIKNVMGPDEDHFNVTNSAFTNVIAGYALYLGEYANCLCNFSQPKSWAKLAASLSLPYDETLNYHPQFDGYTRPERIKQADVVLLGFPLQYSMNQSTRANDLVYYENVTRETGPAMTWGMHAIGHLKIGNSDDAERLFRKSYQGHVREPFHTWTEYRKPRIGAVNFLTGMGGFMQTVIFGYAGISIHLDRLEILKPGTPPNCTRLKLYGLKYHGSKFTLDIHSTNVTLKMVTVPKNKPLVLVIRKNKIPLSSGVSVNLHGNGPFSIQREVENKCPLPSDRIGQITNYKNNDLFS